MAFSPDGSRLASGSYDKTAKLWDAASGRELATLQCHTEDVNSVAFSPDGSRLASGSQDSTVKLWDAASGRELATLSGHSNCVNSVAFSPDGSRLASSSRDMTVKLWDAASGKELTEKLAFALGPSSMDPDDKNVANRNGHLIRLIPSRDSLDLLRLERKGYLGLQGREITWQTNPSLLSTRKFDPVHWRQDLPAQIAAAESPDAHFVLRLQLCGQRGQWSALPTVWEEARKAGMGQKNSVRHEFAVQAAIAARLLATQAKPEAPESLWKPLLETIRPEDWKDPRFGLPLAQAVPVVLTVPNTPAEVMEGISNRMIPMAPEMWKQVVSDTVTERRKKTAE